MKLPFKYAFVVYCFFLSASAVKAQELNTVEDIYAGKTFYEIQKRANTFFALHPDTTTDGAYRSYKRWEWFWKSRIQKVGDPNGSFNYLIQASLNFAALDPVCQSSDPADWQFLGPKKLSTNNMGAVMSLYVDPADEQFMLVAGRQGGLLQRTNDTLPWKNLTDQLRLPYMHVRSITVEPGTNNQTIYFAGYSGHPLMQKRGNRGMGVFKTTNGGQTWKNIMPVPVMDYPLDCSLAMAPDDPKKLYLLFNNNPDIICDTCTGYYNVYMSPDRGETWVSLGFTGKKAAWRESLEQIYIMPEHPEYVFVAGGPKLWRYALSTGWVDLTDNLPQYPSNHNWKRIRLSSKGSKLFAIYINAEKTTCIDTSGNFGTVFSNLINTDVDKDKEKFLIHSKISNRIYMACPQGKIYRSMHSNTGAIIGFTKVSSSNFQPYGGIVTHHDYRDAYISTDSLGQNDVLVLANDGGLLKTINNCDSYTIISGNLSNLNCLGLSTSKTDPSLIRVGAWDNGLYTCRNGLWLYTLAGDGSRVKSDEQDNKYTYIITGTGDTDPDMYVDNAQGIPEGSGFTNPPDNVLNGLEFKPLDQRGNFLYVGYHDLYKVNARVSTPWQQWNNLTKFDSFFDSAHSAGIIDFCIAQSDTNRIYVLYEGPAWKADGDKRLIATSNGGTTWQNLAPNIKRNNTTESVFQWLGGNCMAMNPANSSELWIGLGGYSENEKVYHTTDGGAIWKNLSNGFPNFPVNCMEVYVCNGKPVLFAGTDAGVYYKREGSDWQCFNKGLPIGMVTDMEIVSSVHKLRIAMFGRGIYETPLTNVVPITDIWMQDIAEDKGEEPGKDGYLWTSNDIWVRRADDNGLTHQNPEYRANPLLPNYVYVRVKNRGCTATTGERLKLYWAKASTALSWPKPWDGSVTMPAKMGSLVDEQTVPALGPGASTIVKFPWSPPNPADYVNVAEKEHFCLLARIETDSTAPYGMSSPETANLYENVKNNNNIAWKNVTVIDSVPGDLIGKGSVLIGNLTDLPITIRLDFSQKIPVVNQAVKAGFQVQLRLGDPLIQKWIQGGMQGNNTSLPGSGLITLTGPDAWMGNISIGPDELYDIEVLFKISGTKASLSGNSVPLSVIFDLVQTANDGTKGGERFYIDLNKNSASKVRSARKKRLDRSRKKNSMGQAGYFEGCCESKFVYYTGNDTGAMLLFDQKSEEELKLYPNPATYSVRVEYPECISGIAVITLTDIWGRTAYKTKVSGTFMELPLDKLKAGPYTLSYSSQKKRINKRLVLIE